MVEVKFLADYRGVLTGELFFKAGDVVEFDVHAAEKLVEAGRAEHLPEKSKPKIEVTPEPEPVEPDEIEPKAKKAKKKVKK